ncbi:MAG: hypothetical protein IJV27_07525 [Prevotella sp.]|nr:hypothetical protein [Prevotella sp.]
MKLQSNEKENNEQETMPEPETSAITPPVSEERMMDEIAHQLDRIRQHERAFQAQQPSKGFFRHLFGKLFS